MPEANPFAELVKSLPERDFSLLASAVKEHQCRKRYGFGSFAEAAALFRPDPGCPVCEGGTAAKDGRSHTGPQRYRCAACGARYNSLTSTVLEGCKKGLPAWVGFINLMRFNVPLRAIAEICQVTLQTAFEWRHRVFAAVDGYQDRLVLKGRVWIDEAYITGTELPHGYGEARKRGLSKQKTCIAVAIDVHKNPIEVVCGHGKPSSKRIKDGLLPHIGQGSVIVHDKERAHNALIKAAGCSDVAYKADASDQQYLDGMAMINNLCSWLKRYLWRFTGMKPANLQSHLNWFVYLFRINMARDKWPEMERVVRHIMMVDTRFRSSR